MFGQNSIFAPFKDIDMDIFQEKKSVDAQKFTQAVQNVRDQISELLKQVPKNNVSSVGARDFAEAISRARQGLDEFVTSPSAVFVGQAAFCHAAIAQAMVDEFNAEGALPNLASNQKIIDAAREILPVIIEEFRATLG